MAEDGESWYARPVFFVADCEAAVGFYAKLGFRVDWRHEEAGRLIAVQVARGGAELILNENAARAGGGRLFVSLNRGQVAQYIADFRGTGIEAELGYWGMPVQIVKDTDGNELLFHDDELSPSDQHASVYVGGASE